MVSSWSFSEAYFTMPLFLYSDEESWIKASMSVCQKKKHATWEVSSFSIVRVLKVKKKITERSEEVSVENEFLERFSLKP